MVTGNGPCRRGSADSAQSSKWAISLRLGDRYSTCTRCCSETRTQVAHMWQPIWAVWTVVFYRLEGSDAGPIDLPFVVDSFEPVTALVLQRYA